ncbi:hypothetical protein M9H77_16524 [Catharanthus roseus]|uniref:Uncharacterized protein n=1 Tax=Catharanthus roseus TaxID=4058 RepID=A0ACC0B203_CATRO|nr:hypothetical protein M9H77_16524 [Catharanthus roseus]
MIENGKCPRTISSLIVRKWNITFNQRHWGFDLFVLADQAELVSLLIYPGSKRPRTDWISVMKSRPRLIDVSYQDDVFQEKVDIHEGLAVDVTIEEVGPLVHESHSSEELDIAVETYFEEVKIDETKIEWDSDEDSNEEIGEDSDAASDNDSD